MSDQSLEAWAKRQIGGATEGYLAGHMTAADFLSAVNAVLSSRNVAELSDPGVGAIAARLSPVPMQAVPEAKGAAKP